MKKGLLLAAFVLFLCSAVFAGPFGIEFGWTYDQLVASGVKTVGDPYVNNNVKSYLITPVKTHSSFDYYIVRIDEKEGVYSITALGTVQTSEYGTEAKWAFDNVKGQLTKVYGKSFDLDVLKFGSIWDEPQDWMMSLVKQDRTCSSYWGFEGRPDHLEVVMLELTAENTDEGSLRLEYDSDKMSEIIERFNNSQASVL